MNIQENRHVRLAWYLKTSSFVLFFLVSVVLCQTAVAQSGDSQPVARLVTATGYSRPRLVTLSSDFISTPEKAAIEANAIERRAFERTNLVRIQNGLRPLTWDAELCRLARINSENMARRRYFSHVTPEGLRLR